MRSRVDVGTVFLLSCARDRSGTWTPAKACQLPTRWQASAESGGNMHIAFIAFGIFALFVAGVLFAALVMSAEQERKAEREHQKLLAAQQKERSKAQ